MITEKRFLWPLFALMIIAQLAVPLWMIYQKKNISNKGYLYKFELEARDPNDPFRGKYITLRPKENIGYSKDKITASGKTYATFTTDSLGFAKVKELSNERPANDNYLEVKTYSTNLKREDNSTKHRITYPFTRYYMNENISQAAEDLSVKIMRDSTRILYAEVTILDGQSYLKAVKVDGESIESLLTR